MRAKLWARSPDHFDLLDRTRVADRLSDRPPLVVDLHKHLAGVGEKGTHMPHWQIHSYPTTSPKGTSGMPVLVVRAE